MLLDGTRQRRSSQAAFHGASVELVPECVCYEFVQLFENGFLLPAILELDKLSKGVCVRTFGLACANVKSVSMALKQVYEWSPERTRVPQSYCASHRQAPETCASAEACEVHPQHHIR